MNYETLMNDVVAKVEAGLNWVMSDTDNMMYSVAGLVVCFAVCVFFHSLKKCGCKGYGVRVH